MPSKLSDDPEKRDKSLANLKPIKSAERARELQLKSAKVRSERRQALEDLKLSAAGFGRSRFPDYSSEDFFRMLLDNQDHDTAIRIAGQLAEYEAP